MLDSLQIHPEMYKGAFEPSYYDREWFYRNPGQSITIRPLMPEELEAQDATAQAFGKDYESISILTDKGVLPNTHIVVVDLLRLIGKAHGEDGESMRVRLPCPEPISEELERIIKDSAISSLMDAIPGLRNLVKLRNKPKGFA